jgi:hypothetical protein
MIKAGSKSVTFVVIGVVGVVLVIMLVIALTQGDQTDNLHERQPSPSPESSSS